MHLQRSTPGLGRLALYVICAVAIATPFSFVPLVRATDQPIDLDQNTANGAESKVSTKVLQTYPVKIENTIYNNAPGASYTFKWPGAGPGGFASYLTAGPGVGTKWVWSTVYQVYSIDSPMSFSTYRTLPVVGAPTQGVQPVAGSRGSFMVPGKSIYPTQVTLSDASLSASLITFFSPEKTVATCGFQCAPGECELFLENKSGATATISAKQLDCCNEPHQLLCDGNCTSYLTDTQNCGECGHTCASDEICSDGDCVCPPGLTQCGSGCIDLTTDHQNCGACGEACASDEHCANGACACDPGLTQCGTGCTDLSTDRLNCGGCGSVCGSDEFCGNGACVCNPGLTQCGSACLDLQSDPLNCGSCGNACASGASCTNGVCGCAPGLSQCGSACLDLQNDPLNCGSCGHICGANNICTAGACFRCRSPLQTACGNQCVNIHTDPNNCGACGNVCDFTNCPSTGQGTCSQGNSCVCSPAASSPTLSGTVRFKPVHREHAGRLEVGVSRPKASGRRPAAVSTHAGGAIQAAAVVASTVKPISSRPAVQANTVTRPSRAQNPNEAPVCDIAPIQQVIPSGGMYTQTQSGGRVGKEIQTTVSIAVDGKPVAVGPCPQVVPVTGIDTSGVLLSPSKVFTLDASGDGLCQPGEAWCNYFITMADLGDTACANPVATLSSPPDQFNLNDVTLLNATSAYPNLPAYPGDGVPLDKKTNTTAFSVTTSSSQLPDVGRAFLMSVSCSNQTAPVLMPITLGIGSACDPAKDIDGKSYDHLNGFQGPVSAPLVVEGGPINYSTRTFNRGSTIPLKLTLSCGSHVLVDSEITPNPTIVSLVHETLGSLPLTGINGDNNANPDDPSFSCNSTACDYQFRTDPLPIGKLVISVRLPDTRVFQAGVTITP